MSFNYRALAVELDNIRQSVAPPELQAEFSAVVTFLHQQANTAPPAPRPPGLDPVTSDDQDKYQTQD